MITCQTNPPTTGQSPPLKYYQRFADQTPDAPLNPRELRVQYNEAIQELATPENARLTDLIARYDAEIANTDDSIKQLLQGLEERGKRENTIVVITSLYGEEFLDHGYVGHGWSLYNEVLHIPMIINAP